MHLFQILSYGGIKNISSSVVQEHFMFNAPMTISSIMIS
jgi:hypothetical protein